MPELNAPAPHAVFVYGSLMYNPVWESVVQGNYGGLPAELRGYSRYRVPGETYPALIEDSAGVVQGRLWLNVDAEDLVRLDNFEGDEYRRTLVQVVDARARMQTAFVYVWKKPELLDGVPWDVSYFEAEGLGRFMQKHVASWQRSGRRQEEH